MTILQTGLGSADLALAAIRMAAGVFFMCSGFNKLSVPSRHATMRQTLVADSVPAVAFNEWWVPEWEFIGGLSVVVGFNTAFCAAVLMIICLVACAAEAPGRVKAYAPINRADCVADWLYLPEVLYTFMLIVPALLGAGRWSVDYLLWG